MAALFIRVDAGARIGFGHLVRCLALAAAWDDRVVVGTAERSGAVAAAVADAAAASVEIGAETGSPDDARETASRARAAGAEWVVVDGYRFGGDYQRCLMSAGLHVLCVDDNGEAGEYPCEIVLNQNPHAHDGLYARRGVGTRLLLGPDFVLLRPEFTRMPQRQRPMEPDARRLLVTLGGGNSEAALAVLVHALASAAAPEFDVTIVTGMLPDGGAALRRQAAALRGRVTLLERTGAMHELMASVDMAVSGGGSTSWELAYLGVPTATIVVAANQAAAVDALVRRGIVVGLGPAECLDAKRAAHAIGRLACDAAERTRMSAAGQALIDGRGTARVVGAMRAVTGAASAASPRG